MKSLLKFSLLSALIIGGKFAKTTLPATAAQSNTFQGHTDTSVVLVHQVLTSEPVKPTQEQTPPQRQQSGSGLITELF
ncbi:hypothetical protein [Hymenobacter properus]|uniref:Uncharacterized protein n=1 Tax=Hymenobacter properus TaxID=2791026 RepID=A0A931BLI2_9BACT|nr:hypothetical protein [Hymenobacter properus]MBF9142458.1 hypothetical protein [Hymenobacter properus]MBR7721265.1 hypothetical protein [Microvirga sp. SRT04]